MERVQRKFKSLGIFEIEAFGINVPRKPMEFQRNSTLLPNRMLKELLTAKAEVYLSVKIRILQVPTLGQ